MNCECSWSIRVKSSQNGRPEILKIVFLVFLCFRLFFNYASAGPDPPLPALFCCAYGTKLRAGRKPI